MNFVKTFIHESGMPSFKVLIAVLLFSLYSCEPSTMEPIVSKSPDGSSIVTVTGVQPEPMEPWEITVELEKNGSQYKTIRPLWVSTPSGESIKIEWETDNSGSVTLISRDGGEEVVPIP